MNKTLDKVLFFLTVFLTVCIIRVSLPLIGVETISPVVEVVIINSDKISIVGKIITYVINLTFFYFLVLILKNVIEKCIIEEN